MRCITLTTQTKTSISSDIFDDIALNYLGRVVKAGDCNRASFVDSNLNDSLANKLDHILKH